MGAIKDEADRVYSDFTMAGVEASGKKEPPKADIRALFKTVDVAVYAAQAGYPIVADLAARDAFFADAANQGKLVYVNNNNDADDDPANGVYEYVDGAPRIATGFYQGISVGVQSLVDEAASARDDAEGFATETRVGLSNAPFTNMLPAWQMGIETHPNLYRSYSADGTPLLCNDSGNQNYWTSAAIDRKRIRGDAFNFTISVFECGTTSRFAAQQFNGESEVSGTRVTVQPGVALALGDPVLNYQHLGVAIHPNCTSIRFYVDAVGGDIKVGRMHLSPLSTAFSEPMPAGSYGAVFDSMTVLPTVANGAATGGWTCTGLDRITAGAWAGCWAMSNEGRPVEGSEDNFDPRIFIVAPDFSRVLLEYSVPSSAQGAAVDRYQDYLGANNTLWLAHSSLYQLRNYYLDGVNAGTERAEVRIDWSAISGGFPNGLAYDNKRNALWVTEPDSATARLISKADGSVMQTVTLGTAAPDQLCHNGDEDILYASSANNGVNGDVWAHHIPTGENWIAFASLKNAQAIEGIYVDRQAGYLFVCNDGGYHTVAKPALNMGMRYRIGRLPW